MDKFLMRIKDIILAVVGILSISYGIFRYGYKVEMHEERLNKIEPIMEKMRENMVILNSQYGNIVDELKNINRKLNR